MAYLVDEKVEKTLLQKSIKLLRKTLHLIPFFLGFAISRFYQLSFPYDIFLIGILLSAALLFFVRDKINEPPYKEKC